jgi:hypothetical protein
MPLSFAEVRLNEDFEAMKHKCNREMNCTRCFYFKELEVEVKLLSLLPVLKIGGSKWRRKSQPGTEART